MSLFNCIWLSTNFLRNIEFATIKTLANRRRVSHCVYYFEGSLGCKSCETRHCIHHCANIRTQKMISRGANLNEAAKTYSNFCSYRRKTPGSWRKITRTGLIPLIKKKTLNFSSLFSARLLQTMHQDVLRNICLQSIRGALGLFCSLCKNFY